MRVSVASRYEKAMRRLACQLRITFPPRTYEDFWLCRMSDEQENGTMPVHMDRVHVMRFIEAVAIGEIADRVFEAECREIGMDPDDQIGSLLLWLELAKQDCVFA